MACIWVFSEETQLSLRLLGLAGTLVADPADHVGAVTLDASAAGSLGEAGAQTVYVLKGSNPWPESYAEALAALAAEEKPDLVLVAATLRGKDLAAGTAARIGAGLVSEAFCVRRVGAGFETDRLMYGGLALCTETLEGMTLVTVPAPNFEAPAPVPERTAKVVAIEVSTVSPATVGDICPIPRTGADITAAEFVVCVGRGINKKEDLKLAEDLAAALGGAVGCTRSIAEDFAWMPEETYIGLSGAKIKPRVYLSLGVSGQVQHVAGIRDSKILVGVDKNENAPIFAATDYGIVGDLYEIAPLLTAALKAR